MQTLDVDFFAEKYLNEASLLSRRVREKLPAIMLDL
jgi:hypothetical protein